MSDEDDGSACPHEEKLHEIAGTLMRIVMECMDGEARVATLLALLAYHIAQEPEESRSLYVERVVEELPRGVGLLVKHRREKGQHR